MSNEPKSEGYQFSLYLNVHDVDELYRAAHVRMVAECGMTAEEATEALTEEDEDALTEDYLKAGRTDAPRVPNITMCLRMLLDPGSLPGCEIHDSACE